jgi:hypothetical protein
MNYLVRGENILIVKTAMAPLVQLWVTAVSLRCVIQPAIGPFSEIYSSLIVPSRTRFYISFFFERAKFIRICHLYILRPSRPRRFITLLTFHAFCNSGSVFKPKCVNQYWLQTDAIYKITALPRWITVVTLYTTRFILKSLHFTHMCLRICTLRGYDAA